MAEDPIKKWRKPEENASAKSAAPLSGIRPQEYKAFVSDESRSSMLLIKRGTVKDPKTDLALSYGYLTKTISGAGGLVISLTFALPSSGPTVVLLEGEGLGPLLDGILRGTVSSVEVFDPDRHLPTKDGEWDAEAYQWRGPCVVKHIGVSADNAPEENNTRH